MSVKSVSVLLSSTSMHVQQWHSGKICVVWRVTVGDSEGGVKLPWRSEPEGLRTVQLIFIILAVAQSHAARVQVSLKRAQMCVR